ncbi:MAG: hypothetical protein GY838_02045 [bacterium]|nr:hypothetical protein [bacterium]
MSLRHTTILCTLLLALVMPGPAVGARYHVRTDGLRVAGASAAEDWTPANCYATLAAAAAVAAPADSLLLYPEVHACAEAVALPVFLGNRDFTGAPAPARVACAGSGRLILDAPGPQAELRGVEFAGSTILSVAGLTVSNPGGAVFALTVTGCEFNGFSATGTSAAGGGAVRAFADTTGLAMHFDGCGFRDNSVAGPGAAVFAADGVDLEFTGCRFQDNAATGIAGRGGAVGARSAAAPTEIRFEACVFEGNTSSGPGGAVSTDNTSLHLLDCVITGSRSGAGDVTDWSAGAGIAMHRNIGTAGLVVFEATGCTFRDNVGSMLPNPTNGDGGAVLIKGRRDFMVEVAVERCDFLDNYNSQGAGLYVGRYATGTVRYCRFLGNRAWYQGGGAMKGGALPSNNGELVVFDYCEFVDNEAGYTPAGISTGEYSRGGAIMVRNRPRATIRFCTFVDNRVSGVGYAIGDAFAQAVEGSSWNDFNQCVILDSVFWGESGNDFQVHSEGGGLAEAARLALTPGQFQATGVVETGFVWLAGYPLIDGTNRSPAAGSPLIDQGLDQGFTVSLPGVAVPQGAAPDIGAYERPSDPASTGESPSAPGQLAAHPNPFNPRTRISATLADGGTYRLIIHDLRGRRVARLHLGPLPAGTHAWTWEGRDDAGRDVPAGVYLARLSGAGSVFTRKLALVR